MSLLLILNIEGKDTSNKEHSESIPTFGASVYGFMLIAQASRYSPRL